MDGPFAQCAIAREWIDERTCFMNVAMIFSESPFEYVLAVSMVLIPASHAALRRGTAWRYVPKVIGIE